jgi:hypothetical protein
MWGVTALVMWSVAVIGANVSALIPPAAFGWLHSSRLEVATVGQLRDGLESLGHAASVLRQDNQQLAQRLALAEQHAGETARRVGALEVSVPKIVESLNVAAAADREIVTGSTSNGPVTSFDVDGGSVRYSVSPLSTDAVPMAQPMPRALAQEAVPDATAFGVALGPPIDADAGDTAWQSMNDRVGTLLLGLAPLLGHIEGSGGRRLVAGPLASEAGARELCGRMAQVGIACSSVPFTGDPIPLLN